MEVEMQEPIDWAALVTMIQKATEVWPVLVDIISQVASALLPVVQNIISFFEDAARAVIPDRLGIPESDIRSISFSDPIVVKTHNWRTIEVPMLELMVP